MSDDERYDTNYLLSAEAASGYPKGLNVLLSAHDEPGARSWAREILLKPRVCDPTTGEPIPMTWIRKPALARCTGELDADGLFTWRDIELGDTIPDGVEVRP